MKRMVKLVDNDSGQSTDTFVGILLTKNRITVKNTGNYVF